MAQTKRRILSDEERALSMSIGAAVKHYGEGSPQARAARVAAQRARVEAERKRLRELLESEA